MELHKVRIPSQLLQRPHAGANRRNAINPTVLVVPRVCGRNGWKRTDGKRSSFVPTQARTNGDDEVSTGSTNERLPVASPPAPILTLDTDAEAKGLTSRPEVEPQISWLSWSKTPRTVQKNRTPPVPLSLEGPRTVLPSGSGAAGKRVCRAPQNSKKLNSKSATALGGVSDNVDIELKMASSFLCESTAALFRFERAAASRQSHIPSLSSDGGRKSASRTQQGIRAAGSRKSHSQAPHVRSVGGAPRPCPPQSDGRGEEVTRVMPALSLETATDIVDEETELLCTRPGEAAPLMELEGNDRRSSKTVSGNNSSRGLDLNRSSSVRPGVADFQHPSKASDTLSDVPLDLPLMGGEGQRDSITDASSLLRVAGELSECKLPPYGSKYVLDTSRLASGETFIRRKEVSASRKGALASPCQPKKTCWYQTAPENERTVTLEPSSHRTRAFIAPQSLKSPLAERATRPHLAKRTGRATRAKTMAGKKHVKVVSKQKREVKVVAASSNKSRKGSWYTYCGDGFNCVVRSDNVARKAKLPSPVKKDKQAKEKVLQQKAMVSSVKGARKAKLANLVEKEKHDEEKRLQKKAMLSSDIGARKAKLANLVKKEEPDKEKRVQKKRKTKVKCLLNKVSKKKMKVECLISKDKLRKRSKPSKRGKIRKNT